MPHVLTLPENYVNKRFANDKGHTECVEFIRQALSAPHTSTWQEGQKITQLKSGERDPIEKGTAIATFVSGKYPQTGDTGKHAAIYMGQDLSGIQVLDQWTRQAYVLPRTIYWQPHRGGLQNDANAFSVIEW